MFGSYVRWGKYHVMVATVALITVLSLVPLAAAQVDVTPDSTVVAVSDSDGDLTNVQPVIDKAEDEGADVVIVKPDEREVTSASDVDSSDKSEKSGSPDSDSGQIDRSVDGDLLAEETLKGVELMEPKIEEALADVPEDEKILVAAAGNGAGAAGNVLEKIAFDEGPVTKDRILGHILIGDPYRTGSSSEQADERNEEAYLSPEDVSSDDEAETVGFIDDSASVNELPEESELSDADKELNDALAQEDDPDRVGENNSSIDEELTNQAQSGEIGGRKVIPRWQEDYGSDPAENTFTPDSKPMPGSSDSKDSSSDGGESKEDGSSDSDKGSSSKDTQDDANYEPDDFYPGDGSDGQDVNEERDENPDASNGEGSMGDSEVWEEEASAASRASSERGVTSASVSNRVSTPGTGVLGQREKGFGDLEDSTLSVCSADDERCASNGMPTLMTEVLTGNLQKTPELAASVLKGIVALGRLLVSLDKGSVLQIGAESTKCGISISGVAASGGAGVAAVSSGVLAPAAVPAMAGAAVAAGGAAQSCGRTAELGLRLAADIYRKYKSDPDLVQATEVITLIDPDSKSGKLLQDRLPVEFKNDQVKSQLRSMASVGYALDDIRYDEYLEQMADGTGQIRGLNPMGITSLLTVTLYLVDALVKALSGEEDPTAFAMIADGIGGTIGKSSIAQTFGANFGKLATAAGSQYDSTENNGAGGMVGSGSGNTADSRAGSTGSGTSGNSTGGDVNESPLDIDSEYGDRYNQSKTNYNDMDVGGGMTALQFASEFAGQALQAA